MINPDVAPIVSVITPVLNRGRTIDRCLESVRSQSYPNIEHIVVDGGSEDETLAVLSEFEGTYPLQWVSEADSGMYDAVNKGLRMARGEVMAYLNSDDLYLPWSAEVAVESLYEDADVVFGDLMLVLDGSSPKPDLELRFYPDFDMSFYVFAGTIAQPTVFWRRSVTQRIGGFDESYRLIADCDYWLKAAAAGFQFRHLDEILAIQVDHPDTLRTRHRDVVDEEFSRLRDLYRATVRPPWWYWTMPIPLKLAWRRDLLRFRHEARKRNPARWTRFMAFLREAEVELDDRALWLFLLPRFLRRSRRRWLDEASIRRALERPTQ